MPDMHSLTDRTGIDVEPGITTYKDELLDMVEGREKVGVKQLPPALFPQTTVWNGPFRWERMEGN
jgi:hypothetical protein